MEREALQKLLTAIAEGEVTPSDAAEKLKTLPYLDIGFAKIDTHRDLRTGRGEVIFGIGKTPDQVAVIMQKLSADTSPVIATKVGPEYYETAAGLIKDGLTYHKEAMLLSYKKADRNERQEISGRTAVVCAGTADIPIAEEAAVTSELYGVPADRYYDVGVAGIHRLLDKAEAIKKAKAIIVVAGMEGALASVVGGFADVPVIAVPTSIGYGASMSGFSALLTMLNSCSLGVSVVNIDNGFGAGYITSMIVKGDK
jgi:NCAIR mutase (PurE)-related protein